jgi:hypothetical protein
MIYRILFYIACFLAGILLAMAFDMIKQRKKKPDAKETTLDLDFTQLEKQ